MTIRVSYFGSWRTKLTAETDQFNKLDTIRKCDGSNDREVRLICCGGHEFY